MASENYSNSNSFMINVNTEWVDFGCTYVLPSSMRLLLIIIYALAKGIYDFTNIIPK